MEEPAGRRLLRNARDLVAQSWCRGADARDGVGAAVEPWDESAESWSLLGALVAVLEHEAAVRGELPLDQLAVALDALAGLIDEESLADWNDDPRRTHADVVAVLRDAEAAYPQAQERRVGVR
jgi:hypothetical protein